MGGASGSKDKPPEGGAEESGYGGEEAVVAKPEFKVGAQADPVRDAIQAEAVALFEAGAYDDAGEKVREPCMQKPPIASLGPRPSLTLSPPRALQFYYLAEAAHNANDPQQECTALQNMGTSLVMMGLHFEASRCYESAIKLALSAGSVGSQCEVLECLIWVHSERGDFPRAIECVQALRAIHESLAEVDFEALVSDHISEAGLYAHMRGWDEARAEYESALEIARKLPEGAARLKWISRASSELAQACVQLEQYDEGLGFYGEALRAAVDAADEDKQMRAHANMAIVHKLRRDLEAAIVHLDEAVALSVKSKDVFMEGRGCLDNASVLHLAGKHDRAMVCAERALEIADELDDDEARGECSTRLAEILLSMGEHKRAVPRLVSAMDTWRRIGDQMHMSLVTRMEESYVREDTERVDLIDEHADSCAMLVEAHSVIDADEPVPPLLASEAGRGVVLRSLLVLDNALEGDPIHEGYSANVMPTPIGSEKEMGALVKKIYPDEPGKTPRDVISHCMHLPCIHTRADEPSCLALRWGKRFATAP